MVPFLPLFLASPPFPHPPSSLPYCLCLWVMHVSIYVYMYICSLSYLFSSLQPHIEIFKKQNIIKTHSLCEAFAMPAGSCGTMLPGRISSVTGISPQYNDGFKETRGRLSEGLLTLMILNSGDRYILSAAEIWAFQRCVCLVVIRVHTQEPCLGNFIFFPENVMSIQKCWQTAGQNENRLTYNLSNL